jgi:hypothetical protein
MIQSSVISMESVRYIDPTISATLEALELYLNQPEYAIICIRCKYALQPTGHKVSRHLWERHQTPIVARNRLTQLVASLGPYDSNKLLLCKDGFAFFFDPSPRSIAQLSDIMLAASAAACARQQCHSDGVIREVFARESVSGLITVALFGACIDDCVLCSSS